MDTTPLPPVVCFGVFEVDRRSRELRKHGVRIKLYEQPFRVLELLLERPGELITREEFQRQIWPADTFVDFELGLNTAVKRLRRALGDAADTPRFVETLPRRGYRFVFPVHAAAPAARASAIAAISQPEAAAEVRSIRTEADLHEPRRHATRRPGWAALSLALTIVLSGAVYLAAVRNRAAGPDTAIRSIAVLPLDNLSTDPEQEYFADGMTDEIITDLAKLGTLRVISRSSVLRYKHSPRSVPEIAKALNVDAVVEGTVMRSGDRVRINAQLIRSRNEQHLWAEDFDGDMQNVLALQADVARAIANSIQRQLTPGSQVRTSVRRQVVPEAYEAYLRGRHIFWQRWTREGLDSAIRYYTLAIAKDPNYAPVYAALADCYTTGMFMGRPLPPREAWARAAQAATKAMQLDPDLAEAHVALAAIRFRYDWNWAEADREYKRAIELDPNDAHVYQDYSIFLDLMRRTEEGTAAARKGEQLDPLSPSASYSLAVSYRLAHHYDEAIRQGRKTLELDPNLALAHSELAMTYEAKGLWAEAVSESLNAFTLRGMDASTAREFRQAFEVGGMRAFWKKHLEFDQESFRRGDRLRLMEVAGLYYRLGDQKAMFGLLEKAYEERHPALPNIWTAPWLDASRSDPRYIGLTGRMGLPP